MEFVSFDGLSTEERQKLGKKMRKQQLRRLKEWEKGNDSNTKIRTSTINKCVSFGSEQKFRDACKRGDLAEVLELVKRGVDVNIASLASGFTALHQCCMDDMLDVAQLLIEHGAGLNKVDNELWSPLHVAASCGNVDLVLLLIKNGVDVSLLNVDNCFAVDLTFDDDIKEILYEEMERGGIGMEDINQIRQKTAKVMLQDLKEAVSKGIDISALTESGIAPAHIAAANGYGEVIKYLIKKDVNIDIQDNTGATPLLLAAKFNQEKMVRFLLKKNADPLIKDLEGNTPFDVTSNDVIGQILVTAMEEAERASKLRDRIQASMKLGESSSRSDKNGSHPSESSKDTDNDDDMDRDSPSEGNISQTNGKPQVYKYSFIRAMSLSKVDQLFEQETLVGKDSESFNEQQATEMVKKSSKKIKARLQEPKQKIPTSKITYV